MISNKVVVLKSKNLTAQILEMEDERDETREFSRRIVFDFVEQADNTLQRMDESRFALVISPDHLFYWPINCSAAKDLDALSDLGERLKGRSQSLGITKLKNSAKKVQKYGAREELPGDHGDHVIDTEVWLVTCEWEIDRSKTCFNQWERRSWISTENIERNDREDIIALSD